MDPFLEARDPREEAATEAVRECLLRASPPALTFRQDDGERGYALIVPRLGGETLLTVPGLNEADFMVHGNPGTDAGELAAFIAGAAEEAEADSIRIPLLTRPQAEALVGRLGQRLPGWRIGAFVAAVAPVAERRAKIPSSLRRATARAERDGLMFESSTELDPDEIRSLHNSRWGNNRGDSFFAMLCALLDSGHADLLTLRLSNGTLVALQLDIAGTDTRHYYYSANDTRAAPGCGTAILGHSWRRFMETPSQSFYSFGRGAERYKYRYASDCRELFEVRAFYAPETQREA